MTGWRDPFVAPWQAADALLGNDSDPTNAGLYALISGGEKDLGPRTWLYAIQPNDLRKWTFLGPLLSMSPNETANWSGDFGSNFECSNFLTVSAGEIQKDTVVVSTEGGPEREWVTEYMANKSADFPRRTPHNDHWVWGSLQLKTDENTKYPALERSATSLLDWGALYAATTFLYGDRRLLWGWIPDEDLAQPLLKERGCAGCLALPRELFVQTTYGVEGCLGGGIDVLRGVSSMDVEERNSNEARGGQGGHGHGDHGHGDHRHHGHHNGGGYTVTTMGIRPAEQVTALRKQMVANVEIHPGTPMPQIPPVPRACEIQVTAHDMCPTSTVSLYIRDATGGTQTVITFSAADETLIVDRSRSTTRQDINTADERAKHTLFRTSDANGFEDIDLRVFLDAGVLEVFANNRTAIATRVYAAPQVNVALEVQNGWGSVSVWELGL